MGSQNHFLYRHGPLHRDLRVKDHAASDRRHFLRLVQRSRQPFLANSESGRGRGPQSRDPRWDGRCASGESRWSRPTRRRRGDPVNATYPPGKPACRRSCDGRGASPGCGPSLSERALPGPSSIAVLRCLRSQRGASVRCRRADRYSIFSLQWQRTANRDNTASFDHLHLQIEPARWRAS